MQPDPIAVLKAKLDDPMWRLTSGKLYKIVTKGNDDDDGLIVDFVPNEAQLYLIDNLHYRNIILKARQLGFSTLICVLWLDTALFSKDPINCGIIAQDREAAEGLFGKIRFAYKQLPAEIQTMFPLSTESKSEMVFGHNGSRIKVATSMRSGTIHRLHISEFGKICARFPQKAEEVMTGSIPAVPNSGILVIESTAEGQEGEFYDLTQRAKALADQGRTLTSRDYRFHFFPWWKAREYAMNPDGVLFTRKDEDYFTKIEAEIGQEITLEQRAWYVATREADFPNNPERMWQEYPSCIAGHVLVGTPNGIMPIREVEPDGNVITAHMHKGVRPVFEVRTKLGYSVTCTDDHPIKTPGGIFKKLKDGLSIGDSVQLSKPALATDTVSVPWSPAPFVDGKIHITQEFAEFLGIFMGDGCFYNGTMSVACDAGDDDTVAAVEAMFAKFLGGSSSRITGEKRGCVEVRKSSGWFAEPMLSLGIVEHRAAGGLKRKVHVPPFIMKSPENVVAAFLRGLFEADGFASRDGKSIRFFSKHQHVVQEVQLLLLAIGIESRVSSRNKKSSGGHEYIGWELALRANGVRQYVSKVGFISKRKQGRALLSLSKRKTGSNAHFDWVDEIVSIQSAGEAEVFDITTATHEFDAGGIVVHNCPAEAFQRSTEGCYYTQEMAAARKGGRITQVPWEKAHPVNTFWDIGLNDEMAIWFHQRIGAQDRFIRYYENSAESFSHYVAEMQRHGYIWGRHYLPHDGDTKRLGMEKNWTPKQMLEDLGLRNIEIVPRIDRVQTGIQMTRDAFSSCWFDEEGCKDGLKHLDMYRKEWDAARGVWKDQPRHDKASNGADAFRQFGQMRADVLANAGSSTKRSRPRSWRTA